MMDVQLSGNASLDQINLALDALKKQILERLGQKKDIGITFNPRRVP